ncbi:hypothetical protein [Paracoccus aminovorans]|uniref:hypothetical protein n=1 Tax=Paracoccus aminovorans TaxID=34004 RepID=UPI00111380EC|nr:hypothetical protein [Paracoccus aminovorans]
MQNTITNGYGVNDLTRKKRAYAAGCAASHNPSKQGTEAVNGNSWDPVTGAHCDDPHTANEPTRESARAAPLAASPIIHPPDPCFTKAASAMREKIRKVSTRTR